MKKILSVTVLFLFLSMLSAAEIRNPGFESGRKSFEGVGWWWFSTADSCDYDTKIFHSGKRSIRLTVNDQTSQRPSPHWSRYATLLSPVKDAKPDTVYTVRCFVKTEMTGGQAGLAVRLNKKKMSMPERIPVKFLPVKKTTDWTELVYTFKTGKNTTSVTLYCAVEGFTGKAWFDDFSITEGIQIPSVPNSPNSKNVLTLNEFILVGEESIKRTQPKAQTILSLYSKGENLVISGTCFEPDMKNLKANAVKRDSAVWADDCVELFLDAQRSRSTAYHFIINANGALYDAAGRDKKWSPADIRLTASKKTDRWTFELTIPYTSIGYGKVEAALPDKQMAFAAFRSRKSSVTERSSWQPWTASRNFHNPMLYPPILVGTDTTGKTVNFLYNGQMGSFMRPPLAWQMNDPLYEELMTNVPMHPAKGSLLNIGMRGTNIADSETAFALQHGMKKHYAETNELKNAMRSVYNHITINPKKAKQAHFKKYNQRICVMPMVQWGGAHYGYEFKPAAPGFKYVQRFAAAYFYPDKRVQESYGNHVKKLLKENLDYIDEITLGHEGRFLYFKFYDLIRKTYLEKDPETWKQMEEQAKKEYGHGKIGFPVSHKSASPLERIVYQRFVFAEYNKGIKKLSAELRKIKPDIRLISELDPDGMKPYFYEQIVGAYDLICQQMLWGHGVNRQSVAFNCKFLSDIAETPARGGPHIERYFVSMNPEEVNEVISSVFRVGGESLQLWLNDWFGKTLGDYYGAPERVHEIFSLAKHIASMRKLKFPEADSAILYSNIDQCASWTVTGGIGGGYEEAFTVLGPRARSWFKFISDTKITMKKEDLKKYKVIYDPSSRYFEESAYKGLVEYVKNGGTLVVANPLNYSINTDGSKRDTSSFLGVSTHGEIAKPGNMKFIPDAQFPRASRSGSLSTGKAAKLVLKGAKVLAEYSDNSPAVTVNKYGKGKVITFAATPFTSSIYGSRPHWKFFKDLQQDLGCAVNRDIWRFRFPGAKTPCPPQVPENMSCLTGNSHYYECDAPVEGPNVNVKYSISYDNAPDHIADSVKKDKLVNRKLSMNADIIKILDKKTLAPWVVAWNKAKRAAITFTFAQNVKVKKLRLWASGNIPEFEFGCMTPSGYKKLGVTSVPVAEKSDVRELVLDFSAASGNKFILQFNRKNTGIFYLSEVELWGDVK